MYAPDSIDVTYVDDVDQTLIDRLGFGAEGGGEFDPRNFTFFRFAVQVYGEAPVLTGTAAVGQGMVGVESHHGHAWHAAPGSGGILAGLPPLADIRQSAVGLPAAIAAVLRDMEDMSREGLSASL